MYSEACWFTAPYSDAGMVRFQSDNVMVFAGSDVDDPENLNAEIELWIENDKLTLTRTCAVFIPAGAAHGRFSVKNVKKPVFHYSWQTTAGRYQAQPAEATAPVGTYANSVVEKYAPPSGKLPDAPPGFLQLLLFLDGQKLPGAPYMETVWFKTANDTGPAPHAHDFDEFIGFIGTDPEHPEELGATLQFYIGDEPVTVTKSCLVYIPRGVTHSPILVPKMDRPIFHFSGGNGGDYARKNAVSESNMYKI
jgi:mannose-6-phosphate isomerase-like protein (cupin superfamily)